ncbi:MAG: ABC transporter substrate-binding protein [Alphaproteobacteria bacterium]|nr:ABC transporter substrate-binding protein [Alphaproteobacteria bacterium]
MGLFVLARRAFLSACVALVALGSAGPALADRDAEVFAQGLIDRGVGILRNTGDPQRRAKFSDFILNYADARKTAMFTLGNYRRGASEADVEAFVQAFTKFATAVYESRLDQYKGQTLKVTGSIDNKPGDITVNMVVVDPGARDQLRVAFRVLGANGSYRFVDIQVAGIWLSVEQRDQFAGYLSKNGGSVPSLTTHLNAQARQIMASSGR